MSRSVAVELRRAFISPSFLAGIGIVLLGLAYAGAPDLCASSQAEGDALSVFRYVYCFNNSFWFVVVGAAVPFAGSFCEDYRNHILPLQLARETRGRYLAAKLLACALSGGAAVVLGSSLFLGVCIASREEVVSLATGEWAYLADTEPFLSFVITGNFTLYWLLFSITQFIYGAFWSLLGFCVSLFSLYRYAAYAGPFAGALLLVELHSMGLWPAGLNISNLAFNPGIPDANQAFATIAVTYGALILALCFISAKRLKAVIDRA